jgi:hypothetical protein
MTRNPDSFTFFNRGAVFQFKGSKITEHPFEDRQVTMLDLHKELVEMADDPQMVFIMGADGQPVNFS